jgi:hypothetical protein
MVSASLDPAFREIINAADHGPTRRYACRAVFSTLGLAKQQRILFRISGQFLRHRKQPISALTTDVATPRTSSAAADKFASSLIARQSYDFGAARKPEEPSRQSYFNAKWSTRNKVCIDELSDPWRLI